jgi:hypothetical protein
MGKVKFICLVALFNLLANTIYSQTDSLGNYEIISFKLYTGFGGGFGSKGSTFGQSVTFVSSDSWGGSISYKTNILKNKNVPGDYYDDGHRVFAPRDYLSLISLNLVKEFLTSDKSMRIGIEAGPAWVKYNVAQFKLNPSYDPDNFLLDVYKYRKSHTASNTIGLTLIVKAEFMPSRFTGFELAAFTNINDIQSVFGIELYFNVGKVRD